MLIHEMKFVVDNYAIDKTQVGYIFKSDKEYLYLSNALEYTWINIKSNINRYLLAHMHDTTHCNIYMFGLHQYYLGIYFLRRSVYNEHSTMKWYSSSSLLHILHVLSSRGIL